VEYRRRTQRGVTSDPETSVGSYGIRISGRGTGTQVATGQYPGAVERRSSRDAYPACGSTGQGRHRRGDDRPSSVYGAADIDSESKQSKPVGHSDTIQLVTGHAADTILEHLGTAIVIVDRAGIVIYQNPSAETLFGISRKQAISQRLTSFASGLDELDGLIERSAAENRSFGSDLSLTFPSRDFHVVEVACRVAPLGPDRQQVLVEFIDATQSRQFDRETALINQRSASKRIITQLAHEVRNPLGGLRGAAQLLERKLDKPELREYTQVIIGEADRLTALTDDLLGPTRTPLMQVLNVHELIERVLLLIESDATDAVVVERDYDPSVPEVSADQDQLIQLFLNVTRNAVQAIAGKGRLTIRTRTLVNFVIGTEQHRLVASVEIEDDGPGVSADIANSVFYPLVTNRDGGTGLGLPLAQEIAQRHGGLIEFESEPGRTVFMVRLPIDRQRGNVRSE